MKFFEIMFSVAAGLYCYSSYGYAREISRSGVERGRVTKTVANSWLSIIIWMLLWPFGIKAERRALQKYREEKATSERTKRDQVLENWKRENASRTESRKQWFAEHKPQLFYNTVSGVTVVLRPADYAAIQKETKRYRCDGFWESGSTLMPARETVVFVTKKGRELVDKSLGSHASGNYMVAGFRSRLDDIMEEGGAELVHKDDIFVPWINEALMSFKEQRSAMNECHSSGSVQVLIWKQAPAEHQPIPHPNYCS